MVRHIYGSRFSIFMRQTFGMGEHHLLRRTLLLYINFELFGAGLFKVCSKIETTFAKIYDLYYLKS
jgi:hypothetical protein